MKTCMLIMLILVCSNSSYAQTTYKTSLLYYSEYMRGTDEFSPGRVVGKEVQMLFHFSQNEIEWIINDLAVNQKITMFTDLKLFKKEDGVYTYKGTWRDKTTNLGWCIVEITNKYDLSFKGNMKKMKITLTVGESSIYLPPIFEPAA